LNIVTFFDIGKYVNESRSNHRTLAIFDYFRECRTMSRDYHFNN